MRDVTRDRPWCATETSVNAVLRLGIVVVVAAGFASGCASIPVEDRAQVRDEIDQRAAEAVAEMSEQDPEFKASLESAQGYLVGQLSGTTLLVDGGWMGR